MTAEERTVMAILRWQNNPMVHPLTCGRKSAHRLLFPWLDEESGAVVLLCPDCDYKQTHIPPMFAHPLPSDAPSGEGWETPSGAVATPSLIGDALKSYKALAEYCVQEAGPCEHETGHCVCRELHDLSTAIDALAAWERIAPASPPQDAPVDLSAVEAAIDDYGRVCWRHGSHRTQAAQDHATALLSLYRTALSGVTAKEAGETK